MSDFRNAGRTDLIDPIYDGFGLGPGGEHPGRAGSEWPAPAQPPRSGLTSPSSWAELIYCIVDLVPAIIFFVVPVTLLGVGVGLAVIYIGIPMVMLALLFARAGAGVQRILARVTLGLPVQGYAPIRPRCPGVTGLVAGALTDPGSWRAVGYHCVNILLAPVRFGVAVGFYAGGLGGITYPLWRGWLPAEQAYDGSWHHGAQWAPDVFVDNLWTMSVMVIAGVLVLVAAPRVVRLLTTVDRVLIAGLLGGPGR